MNHALARALALFDDCVAMPPAERAAWLDALARRDPGVHRALQALLASDDRLQRADHPLLSSSLDTVLQSVGALPRDPDEAREGAPDSRVGTRLGPWRIERVLSAGGMGTVYEAWRDDGQYQQRVALKCIRSELTSPRLVEGFRREREALAGLDHPGIATLFDGGVESDGQPWFAMRYVQGEQIDAWCDLRKAGLRERAGLLVQACDALAYAHRHRVLHQDIKPSNLMVNEAGQVQMLDFGLTASLAATDSVPRLAASDGYTAPEALAGTPPAVTMDVWSMGVLMYRLLAGALPHASTRLLSAVVALREDRPVLLSQLAAQATREAAQARGFATPGALARALAGDLDAIAARCIAREPEQRYRTIAELRDDLDAWLRRRPVRARKGGIVYRGTRLLQRHRLAASLLALVLVVSAGGLGVAVWQKRQAAHEAAASLALSRVFESMLGNATLSGLGETPMSSRELLRDTERQVRGLPLQEHPAVLARGLSMLARNYVVVGEYDHATGLAQEAARLQGDDPVGRATADATLAALLNLEGRPLEARAAAREGLALADEPAATAARLQLLTELARSHWDLGDHAVARETLDLALALAERRQLASAQAELLTLRGYWNTRLARFAQADTDLRHAIALATPALPLVADDARRVLAQNLLLQERIGEGLGIALGLLADYRARLGDSHPLVGRALRVVANLQCAGGQLDDCAASIGEAERIVRQHYGEDHPEFADVLRVRSLLGIWGKADPEDGVAWLRRAEALLLAAYPPQHETVLRARSMLARRLFYLGPENLDASIALMETVLADHEKSHLQPQPIHRITLAEGLLKRGHPGDLQRARALFEQNTVALRAYPPAYSMAFYNRYLMAYSAWKAGDRASADTLLEQMEVPLRQHLDTTNNRLLLRDALLLRAMIALQRGDRAAARSLLVAAVEHVETAFGAGHQAYQRTQAQLRALDRTGTFTLLR